MFLNILQHCTTLATVLDLKLIITVRTVKVVWAVEANKGVSKGRGGRGRRPRVVGVGLHSMAGGFS